MQRVLSFTTRRAKPTAETTQTLSSLMNDMQTIALLKPSALAALAQCAHLLATNLRAAVDPEPESVTDPLTLLRRVLKEADIVADAEAE